MKSKANIKSHPIHPILIVFPIAFFIGTLVTHSWALAIRSDILWQMGNYLALAGIVSAAAAAIPGIIDYRYTVPPNSSAKKRAAKHGLLNSLVLVLFILAAFLENEVEALYILIIEAVAVILLSVAGWMGGTLVHRNQIGVDPRYANAGKWKEAYFTESSNTLAVADENELEPNQMKLLHIGSTRIVLARTESRYVAFDDRCPHKGGSLAGGAMMCETVQCPWHGSQFSVETGAVSAGPAKDAIRTYMLSTIDGKVFLHL
ncbi:DUF2231 domain-containing protein [Paradesertivirga mongoliensis]|uniref:DUF2231 domain-containing protein n=1 Tax=Paradesertivirga mongoliensis TaxID=2100740 RepID=A0ABW4ZLF2_9SPHI|nr:DUF2231 domain-containing protein [Pedobacter mongoliensis]